MASQGMPRIDLGGNWTPLVRNVLLLLFGIYVVQMLGGERFLEFFAWRPFGAGFQPWQVLTAFFLGGEPISAILTWLTLFFFLPLLESTLGRRDLFWATAFSWFFSVVATFAGLALGLPDGIFLGAGPILVAYTALFGFLLPEVQFLLFFVLPLKAKWIGWGGGLLSFLYFLYTPSNVTSLTFFAWVAAWLWVGWRNGALRRFRLQAERRRVERKLSRLQVIEGGKTKPEDWVN